MTAHVKCPQCGSTLELPGEVPAGKSVRCPRCNTVFANSPEVAAEAEEGEEEDRPRLKKKKKKRATTPIWLQIVGATICLAIIGFCIAIVFVKRNPDDRPDPDADRPQNIRRVP